MAMRYDDVGTGPPVLLLHSGVCDRRMWRPQAEALAARHRVVGPDLPGFGDTEPIAGHFSFSEQLLRLLNELNIEQTAVVGSSFGGQVALELAGTAPERVSSLVLLCPAYGGLEPTQAVAAFGEEEERLLDAANLDGAVELNLATWLGPEAADDAHELVRMMQRHAFELQLAADEWPRPPDPELSDPDLGALSIPTLVVTGGLDMDHFRSVAHHLAEHIPDAHLLELPWAAHLPSLERPAEVTALLTGFLADPSGGFLADPSRRGDAPAPPLQAPEG